MTKGLSQVLHDFLVESQENLERLDQEFVALEREPNNEELLGSVFRTIHSIKGGAGFLNLTHLEQISHYAEEVLVKLRDHSLALNTDITTALLHAVDGIKAILIHLGNTGEEGEYNVQEVVEALNQVIEGRIPTPDPSQEGSVPTPGPSQEGNDIPLPPLKGEKH